VIIQSVWKFIKTFYILKKLPLRTPHFTISSTLLIIKRHLQKIRGLRIIV